MHENGERAGYVSFDCARFLASVFSSPSVLQYPSFFHPFVSIPFLDRVEANKRWCFDIYDSSVWKVTMGKSWKKFGMKRNTSGVKIALNFSRINKFYNVKYFYLSFEISFFPFYISLKYSFQVFCIFILEFF